MPRWSGGYRRRRQLADAILGMIQPDETDVVSSLSLGNGAAAQGTMEKSIIPEGSAVEQSDTTVSEPG
jgi:hypothetical protein